MSMTRDSSAYFDRVAGEWDSLRAGYFSEAVRTAAIRKAYLRPEYHVADVGAGTGFMTAGVAPQVEKVYVLDGSAAMLEQARKNLAGFTNLIFQEADVTKLPLPDMSLDVVFANMVLHHCPDPLAAIREMARLLHPGGRLVITDMDAHPYEWLKAEMADVWQGFDRQQVREWFRTAGLVNVIVDDTCESCCAQSQNPELKETDQGQVSISTFVAVGTRRVSGVRQAVQADYGAAAEGKGCGCSSPEPDDHLSAVDQSACCGQGISGDFIPFEVVQDPQNMRAYRSEELAQAPVEAVEIALGCGNPLALAGLQSGEVVLDIGSGGGMDAFLAAKRVGPGGRVIGVDMTPAMLECARRFAARAGFDQVEFRQGVAEALPGEDATVDVVISNCVINLCEDKGRVFQEAFRVLKPGGRLEVSDVLVNQPFPHRLSANPDEWAGCVYGALPEQEYIELIAQAGFIGVKVRCSSGEAAAPGVIAYSAGISARKP